MKFAKRSILSMLSCVCIVTISFVFAMMPQETYKPPEEPEPLGYFTVRLSVKNASDVYGWQAVIEFDSQRLKFVEATPGDFFGTGNELERVMVGTHGYMVGDISGLFYHIDEGVLVMAQTLIGDQEGKSGGGVLTYIKFAYYTENYEGSYKLTFNNKLYKTILLNKDLNPAEGEIYLD